MQRLLILKWKKGKTVILSVKISISFSATSHDSSAGHKQQIFLLLLPNNYPCFLRRQQMPCNTNAETVWLERSNRVIVYRKKHLRHKPREKAFAFSCKGDSFGFSANGFKAITKQKTRKQIKKENESFCVTMSYVPASFSPRIWTRYTNCWGDEAWERQAFLAHISEPTYQ